MSPSRLVSIALYSSLTLLAGCNEDYDGSVNSGPNRDPVITTTLVAVDEDTTLTTQLIASDSDYDPISYELTSQAQHGTLTLSTTGRIVYTPAPNFFGQDSFGFRISDGNGGTDTGTVRIDVHGVNDPPVITSTGFTGTEDSVLTGQVTYTDDENDAVTFENGTQTSVGSVNFAANGSFTYTPTPNFNGADSITVRARDAGGVRTVTLPITVTPVNDAPLAVADALRLPASAAVSLPLVANDLDVDGDALTVTVLSQPGGGTLSVANGDEITFTPDNGFQGPIRFDYRITDAAGVTSDATARIVIGQFAGVYFIADHTTVGVPELHWFDGLETTRISAPLDAGLEVARFAVSGDGQTLLYLAADFTREQIYVTTRTGGARLLRTNTASGFGAFSTPILELNHDGSQALIGDFYAGGPRRLYHTRVADGVATPLGINAGQVIQTAFAFFSPATSDFYVQAQVGGQPPPMSGTGFLTLFRGDTATPADMVQVGATYPSPALGGGSGALLKISPDGRFAVHLEADYIGSTNYAILAYDRVLDTETPIYQRPPSNQIGAGQDFTLSPDGTRVCFNYLDPPGSSSSPARVVSGRLLAPGAAAPVTPAYASLWRCKFAGDNRTIAFLARTGTPERQHLLSVDSDNPGAPVIVNPTMASNEEVEHHWSARTSQRQVVGVRNVSGRSTLYGLSLDSPGVFTPFATNFFEDGSLPGDVDDGGHLLVYSRRPNPGAGRRDLLLLSTHTANYSMQLTRADATSGLRQFQIQR